MAFARAAALTLTAAGLAAVLSSCSTANISDVYTAEDGDGDHKRVTFYTDSNEVHCVIEAGIGRKDVTIDVLIRQLQGYNYLTNDFFPTNRVIANIEAQPSPGDGIQKVDMALDPLGPDGMASSGDTPFPIGHFQCEAYLDGDLERTAVFNINFPLTCPDSFITPSTTCFGFYPLGQVCKRYGDSSDPNQGNCTCTVDKGWTCTDD